MRARKLDRTALFAAGLLTFPLLATAVDATRTDDTPKRNGETYKHVSELCRASLVGDGPDPDVMSVSDRLALYHWASTPNAVAPAVLESEVEWLSTDFTTLIQSEAAVTLDILCRRYSVRPSEMMALASDPILSMEIDLALSYRGARHEAQMRTGEQEIEVPDIYGNAVKVPASWFADSHDPNAKVINADDYGRQAARMGLREMAISAGGAIGQSRGTEMGMMGRFGQRPLPQ